MMKLFRKSEKGFSLVELMIVVAIIAILAAIAIPAFMRFAMKSKVSEANGNLAAIRTCQESYRAENDVYVDCAENPGLGTVGSKAQAWAAVTVNTGYNLIGFEPDGMVRYSYLSKAGTLDGTTTPTFGARATGDLDDDEADATFHVVKGEGTYPKPMKNAASVAMGWTAGTGEW